MFSTIFIYCFVALLFYYGVLIALDVVKSKNTQNSKPSAEEMEVDISEEARQFMPTEVSRFEKVVEGSDEDTESEDEYNDEAEGEYEPEESKISLADIGVDEAINIIGYIEPEIIESKLRARAENGREPDMLDGYDIQEFLSEVEILASKGGSKLGDMIYELEEAA